MKKNFFGTLLAKLKGKREISTLVKTWTENSGKVLIFLDSFALRKELKYYYIAKKLTNVQLYCQKIG